VPRSDNAASGSPVTGRGVFHARCFAQRP